MLTAAKVGDTFVSFVLDVCQVTDTPGLLNREEDERNAMERLTIASIEHLPTCVVFVMDLTGLCGTSFKDQLAIREHLKDRFPSERQTQGGWGTWRETDI